MAPAFQNTLTFNHCKINYGWICFLKLDNAVSLLSKKPFLPVLDTKPFFAMKIINHHEKQITPSESWDQDGFLCLCLGYHLIQIIGLEFLQRCGHQIMVNTWTVSYTTWTLQTSHKRFPNQCWKLHTTYFYYQLQSDTAHFSMNTAQCTLYNTQ